MKHKHSSLDGVVLEFHLERITDNPHHPGGLRLRNAVQGLADDLSTDLPAAVLMRRLRKAVDAGVLILGQFRQPLPVVQGMKDPPLGTMWYLGFGTHADSLPHARVFVHTFSVFFPKI